MNNHTTYEFSQSIHGVQVKPVNENGDVVAIRYNGPLTSTEAKEIFLHYSFGKPDNWSKAVDLNLNKTDHGWEASLPMDKNKQLNFCFKDSSNNWDNNNGVNWTYRIS